MVIGKLTGKLGKLVLMAALVGATSATWASDYGKYCAEGLPAAGPHAAQLLRVQGVQGGAILREDGQRRLTVAYTDFIDPDTFVATLNGKDVSDRFDLLACKETVKLPLELGGNTLTITATRLGGGRSTSGLPQVYTLAVILREPQTARAIRETPSPKDYALARAEKWIQQTGPDRKPARRNPGVVGY